MQGVNHNFSALAPIWSLSSEGKGVRARLRKMVLDNTVSGPAWERKGQVAKSVKGAGSESPVCRRAQSALVGVTMKAICPWDRCSEKPRWRELLSRSRAPPGRETGQNTRTGCRGCPARADALCPPFNVTEITFCARGWCRNRVVLFLFLGLRPYLLA